jgi:hypothetical protein
MTPIEPFRALRIEIASFRALTAWLAVTIALTSAFAACSAAPPPPEAAMPAEKARGFSVRRAVLLAIAPKPYQLETPGPWMSGVVAEVRNGERIEQVSAHTDGLSDVDGSDAPIVPGDRRHPEVHAATEAFLDAAWNDFALFDTTLPQPKELYDADPETAPPYPADGHVRFYALTDKGLQATAAVPIADVEADPAHPLRRIYDASAAARTTILAHQLRKPVP